MSHLTIQTKITSIEHDSIGLYLKEIKKDKDVKVLSKNEFYLLFNEYKLTRDKTLKDKIVKSNLLWVISVAKQYVYTGIRLADLINEGNIGLIEAIDKFDTSYNITFTTFATDYIRESIRNFVRTDGADISQPANRSTINKLLKQATKELVNSGIQKPTECQILEQYALIKKPGDLKLNSVLYNELKINSTKFTSMSTTVPGTDGEVELAEQFKSSKEWNADYEYNKKETTSNLNHSLSKILTQKQLQVLSMSFGLNNEDSLTNEQIASRLDYTRERVGQILAKCITTLKMHKNLFSSLLGK